MTYLTVVFKNMKPKTEEVWDLLLHPNTSAVSWGHAMDERNFYKSQVEFFTEETDPECHY